MFILIEAFAAAIILIPIFLLLWKVKFRNLRITIFYTAFAIYLSAVYFLTGLPTVQFLEFEVNLNLIPFAGIAADMKNAILNVILFIPLGVMLPLLWKKYRKMKHTLCFGLAMTVAIELLQLFTFRATDINDIITNFFGTFIGYWFFRVITRKAPELTKANSESKDVYFISFIVIAVMFFIQPVIVSLIYSIT